MYVVMAWYDQENNVIMVVNVQNIQQVPILRYLQILIVMKKVIVITHQMLCVHRDEETVVLLRVKMNQDECVVMDKLPEQNSVMMGIQPMVMDVIIIVKIQVVVMVL
jgi:hypothetical protein